MGGTVAKSSPTSRKKQRWAMEMELYFIELVKAKPVLWNPKVSGHTRTVIKSALYEEIAEKMRVKWPERRDLFEVASLQAKFRNLRFRYGKELMKEKQLQRHSDRRFVSSWQHFRRLDFLRDALESFAALDDNDYAESSPSQADAYDFPDISKFCESVLTVGDSMQSQIPKSTWSGFTSTLSEADGPATAEATSSTHGLQRPYEYIPMPWGKDSEYASNTAKPKADEAAADCSSENIQSSGGCADSGELDPDEHFTLYLRDKFRLSSNSFKKEHVKAEILKTLVDFACEEASGEPDPDNRFAQYVKDMLSLPSFRKQKEKVLAKIISLIGSLD